MDLKRCEICDGVRQVDSVNTITILFANSGMVANGNVIAYPDKERPHPKNKKGESVYSLKQKDICRDCLQEFYEKAKEGLRVEE